MRRIPPSTARAAIGRTGRGPGYTPAEDAAIWDACHLRRVDRIRDLARTLGRSETAIRRRYQRMCRTGMGTRSCPDSLRPDRRAEIDRLLRDAAAAGRGLSLSADDVRKLVDGEQKAGFA